jgi:ubiquinone/menaquinone biosynthesis C-methylase UbiE
MSDSWGFREMFDKIAPRYEDSVMPAFAPLAANLVEWVAPQGHQWVLDMGTGTGVVSRIIAPQVRGVVGLDFSAPMVKVAQALGHDFPNTVFLQADAHQLPFVDESFELAVASFGLNATQPRRSLPQLYRILKTGGRLAFQEWGGWHSFDELITNTINEYAVDDEDASPTLLQMRDFFAAEREWYADLQTEDDYRQDLAEYGFVDVEVHEYRPLSIPLTLETLLRYKLAWTGVRAELQAMDSSARGDCLDTLRERLREFVDSQGYLHYDPLIFRVSAYKR